MHKKKIQSSQAISLAIIWNEILKVWHFQISALLFPIAKWGLKMACLSQERKGVWVLWLSNCRREGIVQSQSHDFSGRKTLVVLNLRRRHRKYLPFLFDFILVYKQAVESIWENTGKETHLTTQSLIHSVIKPCLKWTTRVCTRCKKAVVT